MRPAARHLWPVLLLALSAPAAGAVEPDYVPLRSGGAEIVPGHVVVRFEPGTSGARRSALRASAGARVLRSMRLPRTQVLKVSGDPAEVAAALAKRDGVDFAEPDFVYHLSAVTPNDPRFNQLWGLNNTGQLVSLPPGPSVAGTADADIDAPEAWDITTGSPDVKVAVVDSGVTYDFPELAPNITGNPGERGGGKETNAVDDDGNGLVDDFQGFDFIGDGGAAPPDNDPRDLNGHGSHVAGTIAARGNNGSGITGVSWTSGIVPIRICTATGSCAGSVIADAFEYAGSLGVQVVNSSFGGPGASAAVEAAIAGAPNTFFVSAAGNEGNDNDVNPTFPCNFDQPNTLCVAATDQSDNLASFSNFGATTVDLAAPGTNIVSSGVYDNLIFATGFQNDNFNNFFDVSGVPASWAREPGVGVGSSKFSASDSPGGNYANASTATMTNDGVIDLTGREFCQLDYQLARNNDADSAMGVTPDNLLVEGSSNGGSTFSVGFINHNTAANTNGVFTPFSLPATALENNNDVQVRWRMDADGDATVDDGYYVDSVDLRCQQDPFDENSFVSFQGTSMASPHAAGVAALLFAAKPGATVAEVRNAMIQGVDQKPSLTGNVASGGRLNAFNSLGVLFAPPPTPPIVNPPVVQQLPALSVSSRFARLRLRGLLSSGLLVTINSTRDGVATIDVFVSSGVNKKLKLSARVRIGSKRANVKAGANKVRVRLRSKARRRLAKLLKQKKVRSLRLTIKSSVNAGGSVKATTRGLAVKP